MARNKFVFFIIIATSLLPLRLASALEGYINWAKDPANIKSVEGSSSACFNMGGYGPYTCANTTNSSSGGTSEPFDEDANSCYSFYGKSTDVPFVGATATAVCEFPTTHSINRITAIIQSNPSGDAAPQLYWVSIYDNEQWVDIKKGTFLRNNKTSLVFDNLSFTQAKKVKVWVGSSSYGGGSSASATAYIYELYAWGPPIDIGLRMYDGKGIVKIGCEPEGVIASPLRIRKGSATYGISLVDPSDPNASRIRIKTKSGIKALRKL